MNPKSIITWAPGLTGTVAPVYSAWNDIESAVNALQGNAKLCIDMTALSGFAQVPATANLEGYGRLEIVGVGPNGEAELEVADGGQIKNVQSWRTIVVRAQPTTKSPVVYDSSIDGMVVDCFDCTFMFGGIAPLPVVSLSPPSYISFYFKESALYNNHNPLIPVMAVVGNIVLQIAWGENSYPKGPTEFDHTISGPAGATLNLQLDASIVPVPSLPEFLGTIVVVPIESAPGIAYTPADPTAWAGAPPTNEQQATDRMAALLKTLNGGNPIP